MKMLELDPETVQLMWTVIDRLPDNLHDFDRDSFGMANLLMACGFQSSPIEGPNGSLEVPIEP
jgi:hypothetical protein